MRVIAGVLLVLVASTASAQDATEYRDLRAARPDGRKITVKDLRLERDAYAITLRSGVVGEIRVQGGRIPEINLVASPSTFGFDLGTTARRK